MSNSNLVNYTKISPYKTTGRNHAIDTITIHCMAGNLSVETCGNVFQTAKQVLTTALILMVESACM